MNAIHSNWTKPRIYSTGRFFVEDFDILTTVLSALKWREKNGTIKMITDSIGLDFYKSRNMCDIWNEITTDLDKIPDTVNPQIFWAAGKIFALMSEEAPTAALDTDFIVWDKIAFDNLPDVTVIHTEDLYPDVYPQIEHFNMERGYIFNPDLDWRVRPSNTAFYVIHNNEFIHEYTSEAAKFMDATLDGDNLTYMVFAEQRLFSMTAKRLNLNIKELSTLERLFKDGERYFTHTWGMKQQMRDMPVLREDFCQRCIQRIRHDYPEYIDMLNGIEELKKYL